MLQQRKHAWTERKKKPKSEMTAGKCAGNFGKGFSHPSSGNFHKTFSHRQHEGSKVTCYEGNSTGFAVKVQPGGPRTFRKCSLAMTQFLPPIHALTTNGSMPLLSKQASGLRGETVVKAPVDGQVWGPEGSQKNSEKENLDSAGQKETLSLGSSPGRVLSKSINLPCHWEETYVVKELVDLMKPSLRKSPTPDLYKSCLLVLSTRREGGKEAKAQQVPEIFRSPAEESQTRSKTTRKDLLTWRSIEDVKGGEKQSSRDSAFGTDTWSETVEVDLEMGLEIPTSEMDYYTYQRIVNWIVQVNAALFSPSADSLKCPLTEQDTSIKIIYEGD